MIDRRFLGTADAGLDAEVELAAVETRSLDQPLGQGLKADDAELHTAQLRGRLAEPAVGRVASRLEPAPIPIETQPPRVEHRLQCRDPLRALRFTMAVAETGAGQGGGEGRADTGCNPPPLHGSRRSGSLSPAARSRSSSNDSSSVSSGVYSGSSASCSALIARKKDCVRGEIRSSS